MSEILEAIRRRAEMATEGPWVEDPQSYIVNRGDDMICADLLTHADAEFIAHARTDIPRLLAALDAVLALPHEDYCCTKGCPGYGNASCRILKPGETCDGSQCTCMLSYPIRAIHDALEGK